MFNVKSKGFAKTVRKLSFHLPNLHANKTFYKFKMLFEIIIFAKHWNFFIAMCKRTDFHTKSLLVSKWSVNELHIFRFETIWWMKVLIFMQNHFLLISSRFVNDLSTYFDKIWVFLTQCVNVVVIELSFYIKFFERLWFFWLK